jgi:glycerol-3-phosphate cytidylyltransferase
LIVYTGGTFDIFHAGHVSLLAACRKLGGADSFVVVALNTDEFIHDYKGEHPINRYEQRCDVLEACRYVDRVIPNNSGRDSRPTIESIKPDLIVVGQDWALRDYYAQMGFTQQWLDDRAITVVYTPLVRGLSSSKLRRHIID